MVKKAKLNLTEKRDLFYKLCHPGIPAPRIGFSPDWEGIHRGIPNLLADHRACPAIQVREKIGVTLLMPYTTRFFRDGSIEVDTFWEEKGPSVFKIKPEQSKVPVTGAQETFPGFIVTLPESPALKYPLNLFMLGDIRVNTWIIPSGVSFFGIPEEFTLMILPLPYFQYPRGVSVGQALVHSSQNIRGLFKIPIDLDFAALPPKEEAIVIPKGTPMVQYIPVRLPQVELKPFEGTE